MTGRARYGLAAGTAGHGLAAGSAGKFQSSGPMRDSETWASRRGGGSLPLFYIIASLSSTGPRTARGKTKAPGKKSKHIEILQIIGKQIEK